MISIELARRITRQTEKKDNWKEHNTPESVGTMIIEEAKELILAVEKDKEAIEIASEIGDIFYLTAMMAYIKDIDIEKALDTHLYINREDRVTDHPQQLVYDIRDASSRLKWAINRDLDLTGYIGTVLYLNWRFCDLVGLDPVQVTEMKILRNDLKYPTDSNSNSGGYVNGRRRGTQLWEAMGGDRAFYLAYEQIGEDLNIEKSI